MNERHKFAVGDAVFRVVYFADSDVPHFDLRQGVVTKLLTSHIHIPWISEEMYVEWTHGTCKLDSIVKCCSVFRTPGEAIAEAIRDVTVFQDPVRTEAWNRYYNGVDSPSDDSHLEIPE